MRVWFPSRIALRHVGGNTTYTRALVSGLLSGHSAEVAYMPCSRSAAATAALETGFARRRLVESVLHFSADTGPTLRCRTPSVLTVHGVASRHTRVARTSAQERLWRARVAAAIRSTDALITVSESSRDDIAATFDCDPAKITVIPHGVEPAGVGPHGRPSRRVTEAAARPYVLYVGNLEPRKNLVGLVAAMDRPPLRRLGLRLVIAGRPAWNYRATLEAIAASPHVDHLGAVDDDERNHLLRGCTVFAFPSLYEGFGFPVLEALAHGAPVCTSSAGSLAEVAGPALRFHDLGPDGLAEGIARTVHDAAYRRSIRTDGPIWSSQYTWDRSVREHRRQYALVSGAVEMST